jgi:hypothetical protein
MLLASVIFLHNHVSLFFKIHVEGHWMRLNFQKLIQKEDRPDLAASYCSSSIYTSETIYSIH